MDDKNSGLPTVKLVYLDQQQFVLSLLSLL